MKKSQYIPHYRKFAKLDVCMSAKKNQLDSLGAYLLEHMCKARTEKINIPKAKTNASGVRKSVCITDETALSKWAEKNCTNIFNTQPTKTLK